MTFRINSLVGLGLCALAVCLALPGCEDDVSSTSDEQNLVGGKPESRYRAVGYVAAQGEEDVLCGATLIAPNVVMTAAHCVAREGALVEDAGGKLEFGVGEIDEGLRTAVRSIHPHPEAHLDAEGDFDPIHALRLYDLAYLILEQPVDGVDPAVLSTTKPKHGEAVTLVAYGPLSSGSVRRKGVDGSVVLNAKLMEDSIVEIRPKGGGAVCHRDGDEGHAAIKPGDDGRPVLVGVYVGSVTQSFTDCKKYLQFLNGYEATFGFIPFYEDAIAAGKAATDE